MAKKFKMLQAPEQIKRNKEANAPKPANIRARAKRTRVHDTALIIHDKLHLTYSQCVQLLMTDYKSGHLIANRNIEKFNKETKGALLSLFDEGTFAELLDRQIEWAKTLKQ